MKYWESSITRINVRLRVVKVRFTQSDFRILRVLHNLSKRKKRKIKVTLGSRFYIITSLWVVFSLSTLYFKTAAWLFTYHVNKKMKKDRCSWLSRRLSGGTEYELPQKPLRGRLTYRRLGRAFPEALLRETLLKGVLTIAELIAPRHHKGNSRWLCNTAKY